ncbi:MAG: 2-methylaconitate isomerase [Caballeronia sp.]|jgi:2-methylaconitate cis-trans-isomerase PrpF|nr:2-methylaconitate isomerase [Caballeronia sp.]
MWRLRSRSVSASSRVPITKGALQETGNFELDGVTFPAAEVQLEFMDPAAEEDDWPSSGTNVSLGRQ